jgi:methylmalonyl-CoA mutase cobalamin-binding subunit
VKFMSASVNDRVRRAHQEDVSLVGVSKAAPGIAVPFHGIQDALKAERGRGGSSLIVGISRYRGYVVAVIPFQA